MPIDTKDLRMQQKARFASSKPVGRYYAGKAPLGAAFGDDDDDEVDTQQEAAVQAPVFRSHSAPAAPQAAAPAPVTTAARAASVDDRLARLQQAKTEGVTRRHTAEDDEELDEDEQRKRAIRAAIMARRLGQVEEAAPELNAAARASVRAHMDEEDTSLLPQGAEEDVGDSSESSEEEDHERVQAKPMYVKREQRITVQEREEEEREQEEKARIHEEKARQRRTETHELVLAHIQRDREAVQHAGDNSDDEMPEDDDGNPDEEFELWKLRELKRIKWYKDERSKMEREKEEVERRRRLTDKEREAEDKPRLDALAEAKARQVKWGFLQRYYHQGAFFHDTKDSGEFNEEVYNRDYGHATGEDTIDKASLPQVMQVKKWGMKGRTKWTHLVQEDTTQKAVDSIFTSTTAAGAGGGGTLKQQSNMTYDNTHFTRAFQEHKVLGSATYGVKRSRDI